MRCSHLTALLVPLALACLCPPPARASGERVVSVEICRDVQNRRGIGCGDRFPADVGQLHVLLAVRVPPGTSGKVQTVWRWGGQVAQRQNLNIRFDRPGGYRTRARQRISRTWTGAWSLEVLDADGRSLLVKQFTVGEGATQGADADFVEAPPSDEQPPEDEEDDGQPDAGQGDGAQPDGARPDGARPDGGDARPGDGGTADAAPSPADARAPAAAAPVEAAAPGPAAPARIERPVDTIGSSAPAPGDSRRQGAMMLLVGGLLLFIAGVVIVRRRSGRAGAPGGGGRAPTPHHPPPAPPPPSPPVAAAGDPGTTPIPTSPEATDALQRLADLVTELWSRWVAATGGSPQRALNAAWRAVPDPGRLALDHIRLCNALEAAAQDYAAIPPRGTSADILRIRLYAQAPALIGVACSLAVECERLGLDGVGLELAFNPWGGRAGLTSTVLAVLDDGAAALGTTRLSLLPYETKISAARRSPGVEEKPFPVPRALAERLGAGDRIVRVESAPFADAPPPVVWSIAAG